MNYEELWKELKEDLEKKSNFLKELIDNYKNPDERNRLINKKEGLQVALEQILILESLAKYK